MAGATASAFAPRVKLGTGDNVGAQLRRDDASAKTSLPVAYLRERDLSTGELFRRIARAESARVELAPPFSATWKYHQAMLWRAARAGEQRDTAAVIAAADALAERTSAELNVEVDRVWQTAGGDAVAMDCLARGAEFALAGATAGAVLGPIGMGVGAAVGFLIGAVLGLIPFAKIDLLDRWRRTVKSRTPVERCLILSRVRDWSDHAATAEREPVWPAWRWGWSASPFGHTLYGDRRSFAVFLSEIAFEESGDCWPSDGGWPDYALAWIAGGHEDEKRLSEVRHLVGAVRASKGPAWVRAYLERDTTADLTCGQIRARAIARGIPDFATLPETPGLATLAGRSP